MQTLTEMWPSLVFLALFGFAYFLPWINANSRRHRNKGPIAVVNLLLGWTFLGWVVALAWSASANVDVPEEAENKTKRDGFNDQLVAALPNSETCEKAAVPTASVGIPVDYDSHDSGASSSDCKEPALFQATEMATIPRSNDKALFAFFMTGIVIGIFVVGLMAIGHDKKSVNSYSVAEQIAAIDSGNIQRIAGASRIDELLETLEMRFRVSKAEIAAMTLKAQEISSENGVNASMQQLLRQAEEFSRDGTNGMSYAEYLALKCTYGTSRFQDYSPIGGQRRVRYNVLRRAYDQREPINLLELKRAVDDWKDGFRP